MEKTIFTMKKGIFTIMGCIMCIFLTACGNDTTQTSTPTTMDSIVKEQYRAIVDNAVPNEYKGNNYSCVINDETGDIVVNLQLDSAALNSESTNIEAVKRIIGGLIGKSVHLGIKAYNIVFYAGDTKTAVAELTNPQSITSIEEVSNYCKVSMGASVPVTVTETTVAITETVTTTTQTTTTILYSTTKAPTTAVATTAVPTGRTVYVTPTGKRYHYDNNCNQGTYTPDSLENAKKRGLTPCDKCIY